MEPFDRSRIWVEGFAAPAETPEEAAQALAALPAYEPLPKLVLGGWTMPQATKVYVLAGRAPEAIADLKAVTSSCRMLLDPGEVVRAQLRLGEALEKTDQPAEACGAYRKVLGAWGAEKRSVTVAAASARLKALASTCKAR
jgi:hypothetical protein